MKKIVLGLLLLAAGSFITFKYKYSQTYTPTIKIGILQTASHPALDACREEFIKEFDSYYKPVNPFYEFIIKNGEGSIMNLHTAAQELQSNTDIKLFYVIATPALQTLAPLETERPIIFAAVTDPSQVIDADQKNVTGVKDSIDTNLIIEKVIKTFPMAKKFGLIYSPSEINSTILVQAFKKALTSNGLTYTDVTITSDTEVSASVTHALSQVDLLLAPTDNLVANTAPLIAQLAQEYKKPFIVSDLTLYNSGATMALGISYHTIGREAGKIAHEILKENKHVSEIPYQQTAMEPEKINKTLYEHMNLQ